MVPTGRITTMLLRCGSFLFWHLTQGSKCPENPKWDLSLTVEEKFYDARVVFRGLVPADQMTSDAVLMPVLDIYRGANILENILLDEDYNSTHRYVYVITSNCWLRTLSQKPDLMVYGNIALTNDVFFPSAFADPWSPSIHNMAINAIRNLIGWSEWSQWTDCSSSCMGGVRHRSRMCDHGGCNGTFIQHKHCNDFDCPILTEKQHQKFQFNMKLQTSDGL